VELDAELRPVDIGKGEILRQGSDVVLLAIGATVAPALEAARELASGGIEATVVNARFAKPLDSELIVDLASRIKLIVTVEENSLDGGFGSGVAGILQKSGLNDVRVKSIGLPDEFIEQGNQALLRAKYALDATSLVGQVLALFPSSGADSWLKARNEAKAAIL
jgi:1-deoxy-D-xylulose-5-phosphate synthase